MTESLIDSQEHVYVVHDPHTDLWYLERRGQAHAISEDDYDTAEEAAEAYRNGDVEWVE